MDDRIKLAEAMGWNHGLGQYEFYEGAGMRSIVTTGWTDPSGRFWADHVWSNNRKLPDPFTDASDDYAVLEWARKNLDHGAYFAALTEVVGSYCYLHEYRIGYFAVAAVKVLAVKENE